MKIENGIQTLMLEGVDRTGATDITRPDRAPVPGAKPIEGFSDELGKAIKSLDGLQANADAQVREVSMGGGNLHEMAIALEKADISLRLATKVRNKVVEAYNEIMKMGV